VTELAVVTGAFSYTGRAIAEELLARGQRVRTLTRKVAPADPLAAAVETAPLQFADRAALVESLRGARVLYNTYWIRFARADVGFDDAVANTERLFEAAWEAGVDRIVHVSVTNPRLDSPLPYFRGKAKLEACLRASGRSHGIVRPTLVYGADDILLNNIAWSLRRSPVFLLPGRGAYEVQPVSVEDVARLCVDAAGAHEDVLWDAAGEERVAFAALVQAVARAVGVRRPVVPSPAPLVLAATRLVGLAVHDVLVTRDELAGLTAGLLVSDEPARCHDSFRAWLGAAGPTLGRRYVSELARNFRGGHPLRIN
jgi:uncharacterized protein YbjT (DUF2867 family)